LCNENRNLKRDLAIQNTNINNLEKELVLIREKLGKRPIESNETNIDYIITKNIALRKVISHSNTNEKCLNMLIKSSRKSHDKNGIGCDQNNASSSSSIVHPILSTNICLLIFLQEPSRINLREKLTWKDPKQCEHQKRKLFLLQIY